MKRILELDALRGIAAVGVVLFHAYPHTFFFAWSFVDLFFVLSGYLITTIVLRHLQAPDLLKAFYYRRILRIWPVYYLTLIGVVVLNMLSTNGYPANGWLQHLTFTQNVQGYWLAAPLPFIHP